MFHIYIQFHPFYEKRLDYKQQNLYIHKTKQKTEHLLTFKKNTLWLLLLNF